MYVESALAVRKATEPKKVERKQPQVEVKKIESMDGASESRRIEDKETFYQNLADTQAAEQHEIDQEKLKKVLEKINKTLPHAEAKFGVHEATNRIMVKLVDKDTKEIIKEFPPEKNLDLLAKQLQMAGVLIDERL